MTALAATEPTSHILVVGDSLSAAYGMLPEQGWVYLLQQRLQKKGYSHQVTNFSISGDTTENGLSRLQPALNQYHPKIVVLELGANDGLRGLSLKQMRINLTKMVEQSQAVQAKVLLLGMKVPPNLGKIYTNRFHQIYHELANKYELSLVPFLLKNVAGLAEFNQEDGLHPNEKAQPLILDTVWEKLFPLLTICSVDISAQAY